MTELPYLCMSSSADPDRIIHLATEAIFSNNGPGKKEFDLLRDGHHGDNNCVG